MFRWALVVLVVMMALPVCVSADQKQDKQAVIDEISAFLDSNPTAFSQAVFILADAYSRDNKMDQAIALYEKARNVITGNEDILNRLANLYNQKQNYEKAADAYKELSGLKPDNISYVQMLSYAYKNAGQKDKAVLAWENLMKGSKNAEVFIQAAHFYSGENETDKAVAVMKKATELAPDNLNYLQTLEGFYMRAEKLSEAEALCNKILATAKDRWLKDWSSAELINIYQKQGKLADLAGKFEKDLSQFPKDIDAYRRLSELYQRNNERDKAMGVYEKAVANGIADRDIKNRLLDLYEQSNNFDKAEEHIRGIIAESPQETYLNERLANLLNSAGKRDEAKKVWEQFLVKSSKDAGAFLRYGDKLNDWGDTEGAIKQYRKAQEVDPNNLWYSMRVVDILISKVDLNAAKKELDAISAKPSDAMMKHEIERRVADFEARLKAAATVPPTADAPVAAPAVTAPEEAQKEAPKAKPIAPAKPEKKRGLFNR